MIRILLFLLWIFLIAGAITFFANLDSRISGEAFGYKFDGPSGLIVGGLFAAFIAVIYITHKTKDIIALPKKIRAHEEKIRRDRGMAALTRGLEAVAVGDANDAAHHARVAQRHLDDMALTRLLTAQAAQMSGDEAAAHKNYTAMLKAPETEFLGLKGLYMQAMTKGDQDAARHYAERAFRLRSNAQWAFESVIELGLARGAWGETREAIEKGRANKLISPEAADRGCAALLTADAYAANLSGDDKTALHEVSAALKLAPSFTPAAVLAARLYMQSNKLGKAVKTLEQAFAGSAHPSLLLLHDRLYKDEEPHKRAEKLHHLATKNPEAQEARLAEAKAHILLGEWASAIAKLEPSMMNAPTALEYTVMADAVAGLKGKEEGRIWLERAAAAPRNPLPGADGAFHFTRDGWARLVREYMDHARLAPPPLEEAEDAVTAEEIRLLTAPSEAPEEDVDAKGGAPLLETGETEAQNEEPAPRYGPDDPSDHKTETVQEDDAIQNDEDAERIAAAAREVS